MYLFAVYLLELFSSRNSVYVSLWQHLCRVYNFENHVGISYAVLLNSCSAVMLFQHATTHGWIMQILNIKWLRYKNNLYTRYSWSVEYNIHSYNWVSVGQFKGNNMILFAFYLVLKAAVDREKVYGRNVLKGWGGF